MHSRQFIFAILLSILLIPNTASAGLLDKLNLPKIKVPAVKIPGLEALTGGDDPIVSTSIADAHTDIPYLDDYTPKYPLPLDLFRPSKDGDFKLPPGAFEFNAQSYCIHAGTYGPTKGDGYTYAPLKGSKSNVITSIMKQSIYHPEIPQENVQTLTWAVLARTKINEMSPEDQKAASKLLSKEQLKDLQGSALDVIPNDAFSGILEKATEPLQRVLNAENDLRRKLTDSTSSYDELEKIAILRGEHERGEGSRDIPAGRWSYCCDGYFVRYMPDGYTKTHIELYVPEKFNIQRDDKGRIASVSDRNGMSIELTYDDSIQPLSLNNDSQTKAYAFKSIKMIEKLQGKKMEDAIERNWSDTGWTFAGIPNGKGSSDSANNRFSSLDKRYKDASGLMSEFDNTTSRILKERGIDKPALLQSGLQDMADLSHLRTALAQTIGKEDLKDIWVANQLDRLTNAWQSALMQRVSTNGVQVAALPGALIGLIGAEEASGPGSGASFNPSGGVAAPGDTAKQRLSQSGRPSDDCNDTDNGNIGEALQDALKKHGLDVGNESLDIRENGSGDCRIIRFHVPLGEGNKPLPKLACAQAAIASGSVPKGSMESPKEILFGSVMQCGDETMVTVRKTDLETGEVKTAGRGRSDGNEGSSTESAANDALGGMGL